MTSTLENFMISHPAVTLSHTDYGLHFHLGNGVNILTTPSQRLQTFVEDDGTSGGSPYRFLVVGRLASFKIVEDSVCASSYCYLDSKLTLRVCWVWAFSLGEPFTASSILILHRDFPTSVGHTPKNWRGGREKEQLACAGGSTHFIYLLLLTVHVVCTLAIFERAPDFQSLQCIEPSPVFSRYRGVSSRYHWASVSRCGAWTIDIFKGKSTSCPPFSLLVHCSNLVLGILDGGTHPENAVISRSHWRGVHKKSYWDIVNCPLLYL